MYSIVHMILAEGVGYRTGLLILVVADGLALLTVPSMLLRRSGRPMSALSWLLALMALPYIGVAWWWLLGRETVERRTRSRRRSTRGLCRCLPDREERAPVEAFEPILPRTLFGNPDSLEVGGPSPATSLELLVDGERAFEALAAAIEGARHFIHLEFYIWNADETGVRLRRALEAKAREGVEVRVMIDPVGSPSFRRRMAKPLEAAGATVAFSQEPRWLTARPTFNFRNHRKVLVVDGVEGFTGGMNLGNEYENDWHDALIRMRGPAVQDLHLVFLDDWLAATGELLADARYSKKADSPEAGSPRPSNALCAVFASGPEREGSVIHDALLHAIHAASDRVWLTTPYLIPSEDVLTALRLAVQRGVDVRALVPARSDVLLARYASRAYYRLLVEAGARVYEYQPRILHMKSLVIDDDWSMLGSANVDTRSFRLNFELSVFVVSKDLNASLREVFVTDLEQSREIAPKEIANRSTASAMVDSLSHLASPLL